MKTEKRVKYGRQGSNYLKNRRKPRLFIVVTNFPTKYTFARNVEVLLVFFRSLHPYQSKVVFFIIGTTQTGTDRLKYGRCKIRLKCEKRKYTGHFLISNCMYILLYQKTHEYRNLTLYSGFSLRCPRNPLQRKPNTFTQLYSVHVKWLHLLGF